MNAYAKEAKVDKQILLYVGVGILSIALCVIWTWLAFRRQRRKRAEIQASIDAREQAMRDSLKFSTKDEFIQNLRARILHSRFITPMVVLSQLQFGTIDREELLLRIAEFDVAVIKKAVQDLVAIGME